MLEESVVYQDILQKGEQRGLRMGAEQEARKLALRLLRRRFGKPSRGLRQQIEQFVSEQLEALCEALVEFKTKDDLTRWLEQHAPKRRNEV